MDCKSYCFVFFQKFGFLCRNNRVKIERKVWEGRQMRDRQIDRWQIDVRQMIEDGWMERQINREVDIQVYKQVDRQMQIFDYNFFSFLRQKF